MNRIIRLLKTILFFFFLALSLLNASCVSNTSPATTAVNESQPLNVEKNQCSIQDLTGYAHVENLINYYKINLTISNYSSKVCDLGGLVSISINQQNKEDPIIHSEIDQESFIINPGGFLEVQLAWTNGCNQDQSEQYEIGFGTSLLQHNLTIPFEDPNGNPIYGSPKCDDPAEPTHLEIIKFSIEND